jgi:coenzyme PQQ biosynthesis protein PqqD
MAELNSTAKPRLAAGCRWSEPEGEDRTLLFPEGAIRLRSTGRDILEHCDGEHTVQAIVEEMQKRYGKADPAKVASDVATFLQQLNQKRILDF